MKDNSAVIRLNKMGSRRGFCAAVFFLAAIPLAVLGQMFFGIDTELSIHFLCGAGFALLSFAVFDFKIPKGLTLIGCLAAISLAIIFLLQGFAQLVQNASLSYFVFQVLGQNVEAVLVKLVLLWFVALLFFDSRGKTRILGLVVMCLVAIVELYSYSLAFTGSPLDEKFAVLKILYLLPFVWLFFESKGKISSEQKAVFHN